MKSKTKKEEFLERYRLSQRKLQNYLFRVELKDLEIEVENRRLACERVGVSAMELTTIKREEVGRARNLSDKVFGRQKSNFGHDPYVQEETFRKPNGHDFSQAP